MVLGEGGRGRKQLDQIINNNDCKEDHDDNGGIHFYRFYLLGQSELSHFALILPILRSFIKKW